MKRQLFSRAWMLLLAAVLAIPLSAQQVTVQVDNEGGLWDALEAQGITDFSTVKSLKVTGVLGSTDFQLIKNLMTGLEDVDLSGTTMTEVPERLFYEKQTLKTVRLPEKVTHFYSQAFCRCWSLISVTFGNQVAVTGKIVFPASFRRVENEAFNECRLLTHLDFTACPAFEGFGWNSCPNCFGLQQVLLPSEGNFNFDGYCFSFDTWQADEYGYGQCFQEITLTKAVNSLGDNSLPNRLKTMYVESVTPPNCSDFAFDNIEKDNLTVYIPKGSKRLYAVANGWTKIYSCMQELGFKINISGYGAVQKGSSTYNDGDVCFPNLGYATILKAVPEIGCELISVKLDGNELTVAADGTFIIPVEKTAGTLEVAFTANILTIENPNGGELKSKIAELGRTPATIRTLKVVGKLTNKDWNFVTSSLPSLEAFDISETDVTSIPESVLRDRQNLTTVHLPSTVVTIDRWAFCNCQQLTTVDGCENVEEIRERAFQYCNKLANFPFGDKIRSIEAGVFENCASLPVSLVMPASLTSLGWDNMFNGSSIRSFDLSQCTLNQSLQYNPFGKCTSLLLPEYGDYQLNEHALEESLLKELRIPVAVSSINYDHVLPATLERLYVTRTEPIYVSDNNAFANIDFDNCTLYVPVGSMDAYSEVNGWSSFINVQEYGFKVSISGYGSLLLGDRILSNDEALFTQGNATTLKAVPELGNDIISVTLNDSALPIGNDGTFTIPAEATIGTLYVSFTTNPITINNSNGGELKAKITEFGIEPSDIHALKVTGKMTSKDWNFVASSLQMIEFFDISETDVTSIPESVLRDRQNLTTVHLPSTVVTIDRWAFCNCQQLTTVDGCENVEEIRERAFQYCNKLANFPFGDKIRSIEAGVFENCASLPVSLVMPASLTSLGWDNMFNGSSIRSFDLSQCTLSCGLAYNTFGKCTSLLLPEYGDYQLNEHALEESLLKELRIPVAVSSINNDHVLPATLERLYVTRTEPIYVSDNNAFDNIDFDNCTLYVPVGSAEAYSDAKGWSEFIKIKECGFIIKTDSLGILRYEGKDYQDGDAFFPAQEGTITMQIIPSFGYEIATLKVDGTALDYDDDGKFTIPATIIGGKIEVTFAKKQLEIAVTMVGNGSYSIDGQSYTSSSTLAANGGEVLKLQLQPATGSFVKQVTIDGKNQILKNGGLEFVTDTIGTNIAISILFSDDATGVANITFQIEGGGVVTYSGETFENGNTLTLQKGENITLNIAPTGDYNFQSLLVNDADVTEGVIGGIYTLSNITTNTTIHAIFSSPNVMIVDNPNGGELKETIAAMGGTPGSIRVLKVKGKMTNKDWNLVMSSMPVIEEFDISETDVKVIPESAFSNRDRLTTVHLPSTVVTINNSAFNACYQLTAIDGCENVQEIGSCAFAWCQNLKNFPFGDNIQKIESDAFNGCGSLPEEIVMPASLNYLGWSSVFNGTSIRSFDLSQCTLNGSIAYDTFGGCTSLKLPENGDYSLSCGALRNAQLTELRMPAAVSYLDCDNVLPTLLEHLYVSRTEPIYVGNDALKNLDFVNCTLYVPVGSVQKYEEANGWMNFTNIKEFGFKVKTNGKGKVKHDGREYKDEEFFFPIQGLDHTMQIIPSPGYELATLKVNGVAIDYSDDGTFTIPAAITGGSVEATFTNKHLEVAISIEGNGTYTINGIAYSTATTYPMNGGDVVKMQLQPAEGYFVKQVTINGKDAILKNGGQEIATTALDENTNIAITFSNNAESVAIVTFEQEGFGLVNFGNVTFEDASTLTLVKGKSIALEIVPSGDSNLQALKVNGTDVMADVISNVYALNNVTANTTVSTTFFSPNMIAVENPNGGELKDLITAMGSTPRTIRALKVVGKLTNKDWVFVTSNLSRIEVFDISETNVESVPESAFRDHQYLTTVHLPSTVTTINNWTFYNCQQLTVVDGCDNVEEIGERAFEYCSKLANFPFGNKLRSLSSGVFGSCSSLPETLVMPASLSTLGWDNVFNGSSIRTFDLSQCTLSCDLAYNTFGECTSLLLPEKGDYHLAYSAMSEAKFKELRLPAALSYIYGEDVLPATLERLYVTRSTPIDVGDNNSFRKIDFDNCTLYVPVGSVEAYSDANRWAEFNKVVEYGLQVTVGEQGKLHADGQTLMGTTTFFPKGAVTFTIIPNAGWHADAVMLNDMAIPFADNKFTLGADQLMGNLTVTFAINQFNLDLQIAGNGKVKLGSLEYTKNQILPVDSLSKLNFTLVPAEGLVVSGITFNGKESVVQNGGTNYVTPAIVAHSTLVITFGTSGAQGDVVTYTVTTGENGSVEYLNTTLLPQTTIQVKKRVDAVFTIKPDDYYVIEKVLLNNANVTSQVDADGLLTIKEVSADATLQVSFAMNHHIDIALEDGMRLNKALSDVQKQEVTKITITGQLADEDFYTMRDKMPQLAVIDLTNAQCTWIPDGAFCTSQDWESEAGKRTLTSVLLPKVTEYIGYCAFAGCTNLTEVNFTELTRLNGINGRAFHRTGLTDVDLSKTIIQELNDCQFRKCSSLARVVLPHTITSIGNAFQQTIVDKVNLSDCTSLTTIGDAFSDCQQLEDVVLPEGLQTLNYTFSNCKSLKSVNFPSTLRTIGDMTFYNTQITSANLQSLTQLQRIGGSSFAECHQLTNVTLPASLQQMGDAFRGSNKLTAIDMSQTQLTTITGWTFSGCSALENVKMPKELVEIGAYAFEWTALNGIVELPATLTRIAEGAFNGTLFSVVKPLSNVPPTFDNWAFSDKVVAAIVPEGTADAYRNAPVWEDLVVLDHEVHADVTVSFEGNLAVDIVEQAMVAPATVTHLKVRGPLGPKDFAIMRSNMTLLYDLDMEDAECSIIPENAFLDKKVLMNVKLPRELLVIQENAFRGCSALKGTLTLPQGVTTIGWAAFQGCSSLEKVELSPALEVIRGYAFEGCSQLQQEITFPTFFTSLGEYAFANCRNLYGTVKFNSEFYMFMGNEGYWSSTGRAFENCSNIEVVDMSECDFLYQLPQGVFASCTSLHTVMLPPYLERIEYFGFENCASLRDIKFPSSLMYIDGYSFQNCTSLQRVDLSNCRDFGTLGEWTFNNCTSLEAVSLPASLNWIDWYCFNDCRRLAELNVEALQPADLGAYVFRHVHTERCVLSIPTGTYSDYLSAPQWGEFVSMRKAIDVSLDEGASLTYTSGNGDIAAARGMRRAPADAQHGNVSVKDGSSLYVAENDNVTFYISPDENVSIKKVLFNGKDVTGQLQDNAFVTPSLTENTSFQVLLNVDGPITVKELRMIETEVAIQVAESHQIVATVYPNNATNKTIVWMSSDEEVARVSANGTVTGVSAGRATITARTEDGNFEKTCEVIIMSNDYYITLDDAETFVENVLQVPVMLHNADNASSIQFDVYLSEGVGMDNEGNGDYGVVMSSRSNGHTVTAARRSDGSVRVLVYSNDGNAFYHHDGELLTLPINTREETGEFEVAVKNIHITGPKSFDFSAPDYTMRIIVKDYPLGDSNGNGEVTVTDVVNTVEEILEHYPERFIRKAADANKDGIITVSDVTATVGIMLGWDDTAGSRMASPATTIEPAFSADDATMTAGGQQSVAMRLNPANKFTALQCDVFLPDGITIDLDNVTSTLPTHIICADKVASGAVRILMMSMANEAMQDADEGVLTLNLQAAADMESGTYTIDIRNIHLVASNGKTEQTIPDVNASVTVSEATAIGQQLMALGAKVHTDGHFLFVEAQKAGTLRLVSSNAIVRVLQLQPGKNKFFVEAGGIYILEGKKVIIK